MEFAACYILQQTKCNTYIFSELNLILQSVTLTILFVHTLCLYLFTSFCFHQFFFCFFRIYFLVLNLKYSVFYCSFSILWHISCSAHSDFLSEHLLHFYHSYILEWPVWIPSCLFCCFRLCLFLCLAGFSSDYMKKPSVTLFPMCSSIYWWLWFWDLLRQRALNS